MTAYRSLTGTLDAILPHTDIAVMLVVDGCAVPALRCAGDLLMARGIIGRALFARMRDDGLLRGQRNVWVFDRLSPIQDALDGCGTDFPFPGTASPLAQKHLARRREVLDWMATGQSVWTGDARPGLGAWYRAQLPSGGSDELV